MAVPRFIADEIPFRRVLSLGRERIVGRAAWRIFRFVGLFSVCVFAVVSRGFPAGSCCRNENVLPAASRAGFRIPAVGDRRFVSLFGGLLAFIRFFAESVALPVDRRFPVVELRTGDALALCEARKRRATAGFEQELATAVLRDGRTRSLSFLGPRSTCPDLSPERSGRRSRMPRHLSFTSFSGTA